jgi:radical SAM protein with 4Fe4S-binding SPASM domain
MLNKLGKRFKKDRIFGKRNSAWIADNPKDFTLGAGTALPLPQVSEPSTDEIRGESVPAFPGYIALEVTNVCNLKCRHCNYRYGLDHYTRDRGFISHELVRKVLSEVKEYNISVLMNYDGEPLMHRHFIDFLKTATDLGINTYFNTNGTLLDRQAADRLVEFYKGSIFFSIDGDQEWFERIRIPANYKHVTGNLLYFIKANEECGWPITIGVSLCNLGQGPDRRRAFLEEWLPKVNYVSMGEVNDKFGAMISDPMTVMEIRKRPRCTVPWQTCGICHNGDVIPCSIYVTRANTCDAIMGNVNETSLKEIWHGEKYKTFRAMVGEERYSGSYCDKCERWLSQFSFPDEVNDVIKISRNGYWTTFQNLEKGSLNFGK